MLKAPAAIAATLAVMVFCACAKKPSYPDAPVSGDGVRVEVASMEQGRPRFYSYLHEGKRIDFFVLKIDGTVRSYLDACAKCGPKKKGYRMSGGELVCNSCGVRYPIQEVDGVGSCYPIALKGVLEGGHYVIQTRELMKAPTFF